MSRAPVHPPRCSPGKTPPPHPHYGPHDLPLTLPHPLRNAIAFYQALLVSFRRVSLGSGAQTPADEGTAGGVILFLRRHAHAPWKSWMRLRREWFGMSCLLSSSRPVAGEVLWVSNHCSMALRSYVWPSA